MYIRIDRLRYFSSTRVRFHSNRAERYPYNDLVETHPMDVPRLLRIARKTIGFFRNNTRDEETPSPLRSILHIYIYILFKKHVGYYRNRIDAFQSADIRTVGWNGNSKSEHVVPAARDREGWGKKNLFQSFRLFSNRKHGGGGGGGGRGRMGEGESESISAGSESRQTTDRTSNPISHHTSCIWGGGGHDVTIRGTHTLAETSISTNETNSTTNWKVFTTSGRTIFSNPSRARGIR